MGLAKTLPPAVVSRLRPRHGPNDRANNVQEQTPQIGPEQDQPYVLVTPGDGRDGEDLVDWLRSAYESDADLPAAALVVFGPFMRAQSAWDWRAC